MYSLKNLMQSNAKYTKAYVEPGEAIGATRAQSIGEPGTQMTLKVCLMACQIPMTLKY